jgi:hypothetical protein
MRVRLQISQSIRNFLCNTHYSGGIQLSVYDLAKRSYARAFPDFSLVCPTTHHVVSAAISGTCVAIGMNPFDLVSGRLYNQPLDAVGVCLLYDSVSVL